MEHGAVAVLTILLAPSTDRAECDADELVQMWHAEVANERQAVTSAFEDVVKDSGFGKTIFFTVVMPTPSACKRALRGDLVTSDIAIQPHKYVSHDAAQKTTSVCSTPLTIKAASGDEIGIASTALILQPASLKVSELETLAAWDVADDITLSLPASLFDHEDVSPQIVHELLWAMTNSGDCPCVLPHSISEDAPEKQALAALEDGKTIHRIGSRGSQDLWSVTDLGRDKVLAGVRCSKRRVILPRDIPAAEMMRYELLATLVRRGWEHGTVSTSNKKRKARIKEKSYVDGEPKRFYLTGKPLKVDKNYLVCLLTERQHMHPVPHLAPAHVYKKILDPSWQQIKKRGKACAEDDWAIEVVKEPRAKRAKIAHAPVLDEGSSSDNTDSESSSKHGSDTGEGSTGSSDSSGSSSSGSSDSSGSSSRGTSSPKARAKAKAEVASPEQPTTARVVLDRNMRASEPAGVNTLTPRTSDGEICGWQMLCTHPDHQADGKCTKQVTCRVAGSSLEAKRLLKAWAIWGVCETNRRSIVAYGRGFAHSCGTAFCHPKKHSTIALSLLGALILQHR